MKKIKYLLLTAACGLMLLSSCTTLKKTSTAVDVNNGVYQYPVVAEMTVQQKVESSMQWSFRPFHIGEPKLDVAKGNLVADVLKHYNADVLLEPQFKFTKNAFGARLLVVTGFPATYNEFRKATDADLEAIKATQVFNEKEKLNRISGLHILK